MKNRSQIIFALSAMAVGAALFYVLCLLPKKMIYGKLKITINQGYYAHLIKNVLVVNTNKLSSAKQGDEAYLIICGKIPIEQSTALGYLKPKPIKPGESPVVPGPPVAVSNDTPLILANLAGSVEASTPYLPSCPDQIYDNILKPNDIFLPHRAYLFVLDRNLYEIIYFYPQRNPDALTPLLKSLKVI